LPVLASIRVQLTSTRISFQPSHLDFGECNLGEKTGVTVQVTNHSTLPQKYGECVTAFLWQYAVWHQCTLSLQDCIGVIFANKSQC